MCNFKYMFGDNHLVHAKMVKTCPKKVDKNFFLYIQQGPITHLLIRKKDSHLTIPLKIGKFVKGIRE